jgi:hypothetical protein
MDFALVLLSGLSFPLRGGAPAVLIAGALLLWLASAAGAFGLWLALVVTMLLAGYAFALLDAAALGHGAAPQMSGKLLSPLHERRPLWLLLLLFVAFGALTAAGLDLSPVGWVALAALLLPAPIALLGLQRGHPVQVLNPLELGRSAVGLGRHYPLAVGLAAAIALLVRQPLVAPWHGLRDLAALYGSFALFALIGRALRAPGRPAAGGGDAALDRRALADERDARRARDRILEEVYGFVRAGRRQAGFDRIREYLQVQPAPIDEHRSLFEALVAWEDKDVALGVGQGLVSALVDARRSSEALDVAERCLNCSPDFRPARAAEAIRLVQAARSSGRMKLADRLLSDFEDRYPGDPATAIAAQLRGDRPALRPRPGPDSKS